MKSLAAKVINFSSRRTFLQATQNPEHAHAELERSILKTVRGGSFWRNDLSSHLADLPVTDYEFYRPALEGALNGTKNPLTGEEILFWCKTSGTSAKAKFFPITSSYHRDLLRVSRAFSYQVARLIGPKLNQPLLFIPSTGDGAESEAGIEIGMISRFMYLSQPKLVRRSWAIPEEAMATAALLEEWGPAYGLACDISAFMGTVPSLVSQFVINIQNRREDLFSLISGKSSWPTALPRPKVSAVRLKQIEKALSETHLTFKNLWPSLTLINTWKSATAGLQVPKVEEFNQGHALFADTIYSATEGWMTVPLLNSEKPGCPLHCGATLVEFAAVDEIQADIISPGKLKKAWELEIGRDYEVVLSQHMGLLRYRLRDVVRCAGFFNRAPILVFQHKSGNQISIGQARVSEVNVLEAIRQTSFHHDHDWTLAPNREGTGLNFCTSRLTAALSADVRRLDEALARINPDLKDDYDHGIMQPMRVLELPPTHPFWAAGKHGQAKMRMITQKPLEP